MTIDFTMARVLKAYPGAAERYQDVSTDVPVLLQLVDADPVAFQAFATTYVASLAPVQLGSRLALVLPWMTAVSTIDTAPETAYRYRPVWRLRKPAAGHFPPLPVASDTIPNPNASMVVAWTGAEITPPAPPATLRPLIPPEYNPADLFTLSNGDLQPGSAPSYLAPFSRYEFEAEGDEFGLLVQPVGIARTWDFAQGAADANFAARYMENPYPPAQYLKQIGAYILTGERSP